MDGSGEEVSAKRIARTDEGLNGSVPLRDCSPHFEIEWTKGLSEAHKQSKRGAWAPLFLYD